VCRLIHHEVPYFVLGYGLRVFLSGFGFRMRIGAVVRLRSSVSLMVTAEKIQLRWFDDHRPKTALINKNYFIQLLLVGTVSCILERSMNSLS
jgi:hypothetical protein